MRATETLSSKGRSRSRHDYPKRIHYYSRLSPWMRPTTTYCASREDVADVLVRCLATPEATGKTFEVQSLPGFEKVRSPLSVPVEQWEPLVQSILCSG